MPRSRLIVMLGPSLAHPGGMTEVVRLYRQAGLFSAWPLQYISTFAAPRLSGWLWPWLRAAGALFTRLAQRRVALVHVHSAAYGSFWRKSALCALAFAFRVPYVVHLHDGRFCEFYRRGCNRLAKAWVRAVLRAAARVVVLSPHWRDAVHEIEPAARTAIIGNPVPVPAGVPPPRERAHQVLFLGWLHPDKGVFDLLRALPVVLLSVPRAAFVLAGSGDSGSLMHLARALGVERSLRLHGWVGGEQKDALLRQADVFVLPSYYEGLPLGALEAMAHGIPVVATRVGGLADLIEHRVTGLLVEPGQPHALAQAIVSLLTDPALRARLPAAAHREVSRRYCIESVLERLAALYQELGVHVDPIRRQQREEACAAS